MARRVVFTMLFGLGLLIGGPSPSFAAGYPTKPVTVIVPFPAGGGTDLQARLIEHAFEKEFGQPLVFVYKTGASGAIGAYDVATAKPDGYTIGAHSFPLIVTNALTGTGRYNINDFDYLCVASKDDVVFLTRKGSPINTFGKLVKAVKAKPGKLSLSPVTSLGPTGIAALLFNAQKGIDMNIVPMQGGAKTLAELLGGHTDVMSGLFAATLASASKVNYLAIARNRRRPDYPNIPTFKEEGYNIIASAARIWIAPRGLPENVRKRLIDGFRKIYAEPDVIKRQAKIKQFVDFIPGNELKKMVVQYASQAKPLLEKQGLLRKKH